MAQEPAATATAAAAAAGAAACRNDEEQLNEIKGKREKALKYFNGTGMQTSNEESIHLLE